MVFAYPRNYFIFGDNTDPNYIEIGKVILRCPFCNAVIESSCYCPKDRISDNKVPYDYLGILKGLTYYANVNEHHVFTCAKIYKVNTEFISEEEFQKIHKKSFEFFELIGFTLADDFELKY